LYDLIGRRVKLPKRPSLSEAQRVAATLREEFGAERALKRCAQECALARRARSRKRYMFWAEVTKIVEASADATSREGGEHDALEVLATVERISELAGAFATMALDAGLPRIAQLLTLARAHAANEARARAPRAPEPGADEPARDAEDREAGSERTETAAQRMAHFRGQRENLSRIA